jgi:hypothetical protein
MNSDRSNFYIPDDHTTVVTVDALYSKLISFISLVKI